MDDAELQTCLDVIDGNKPLGDWLDKPAMPATTVAVTNNSEFAMDVYVGAGTATVTAVKIDGVTTGSIAGHFRIRSGSTISLTYTGGTPTWTWFYA